MKELIRFEDVTYEYSLGEEEKLAAVRGINLSIGQGEFVAIVGHNGSGKSTLAKLANAILLPSHGNVFVDGMSTNDPSLVWNIRQSVGMVFQNPDNQIVATTVEEDVAFGPENLGIKSEEIRSRVSESLSMVDMKGFDKVAPNMLSGGQKQRVAIAGIVAMRPKCIVMDESTAMLDPVGREEVLKTIMKLKEDGISIVLITHFMNEAALADRVIVMDDAKIVMDDAPRVVFSQVDELKAIGLDIPQVSELSLKLKQRGINLEEKYYPLTVSEICEALAKIFAD